MEWSDSTGGCTLTGYETSQNMHFDVLSDWLQILTTGINGQQHLTVWWNPDTFDL